jgi:hypothetical protein
VETGVPDGRQLPAIQHVDVCMVVIQDEPNHVPVAEPGSIMEGSGTGPGGVLLGGVSASQRLKGGYRGAALFEKPPYNMALLVASSDMNGQAVLWRVCDLGWPRRIHGQASA